MIEKKLSLPRVGVPKLSALQPAPAPKLAPTHPVKVPGAPKPLGEEDPQLLEKALMRRMKSGQGC